MRLFDAHAHLAASEFAEDLPAVLARAEAAGVTGILTVGETLADAERVLALAGRHPMIKPAAGLYPTVLDREAASAVIAFVRQNADRLVALGEVGLDHWAVKTESEWRVQEAILPANLAIACRAVADLKGVSVDTVARVTTDNARRLFPRAFR